MSKGREHPKEAFRLRPAKAAKVSEVSETTAASPVPPEERVNFHIGNPAQDERLVSAFFRIALGLDPSPDGSRGFAPEELLDEPGTSPEERDKLEFLLRLIRNSAPYMPRGGYLRNAPNELVGRFRNWLEKEQPDPLTYDLGEQSGVREIILASGGIAEAFRVLLHALSAYLIHTPARLLLYRMDLPAHLCHFDGIRTESLQGDERDAFEPLVSSLKQSPSSPAFLALGTLLSEETRRFLRQLSLEHPLFIIEANDAPNAVSLAREAGMSQRVLRFLTPGIFAPELAGLSTVLIAGNPEFVRIMEIAHFQLKGTPSAPEVEFLTMALGRTTADLRELSSGILAETPAESLSPSGRYMNPVARHAAALEMRLSGSAEGYARGLAATLERVIGRGGSRVNSIVRRAGEHGPAFDHFSSTPYHDLCEQLLTSGMTPEWQDAMRESFLTAFLSHHPEYERDSTFVVSGSSRTALGLLGFHCGIREVIVPDLSWTYEHCFPKVSAVPLTGDFQLNVDLLTRTVAERLSEDPRWRSWGAVALNNPHNATGQAFREEEVQRLLQWLLERNVTVIDDLAYQNVVPGDSLRGPRTMRQLTDDLVHRGRLSAGNAAHLMTIHSVSKTDSLAGSRLAVAEIRHPAFRHKFAEVNATLAPNIAAMFLSYLFYRGTPGAVQAYWRLRNSIFEERMAAIEQAAANLPAERNRYSITIRRPTGSMYPRMEIGSLPAGVSLDWLSSGLARQGIGLLPLSAFARTEQGFEAGRKAFRLTLGGTDPAGTLMMKTRRVLIDLNRTLAEEEGNYNRRSLRVPHSSPPPVLDRNGLAAGAAGLIRNIREEAALLSSRERRGGPLREFTGAEGGLLKEYVKERLETFRLRIMDRAWLATSLLDRSAADGGTSLRDALERELYKDSLESRQELFRRRLFDRTVHPTQMYSLRVEILWEEAINGILRGWTLAPSLPRAIASALIGEFAGLNVGIRSQDEGDELLLDLNSLLAAENALTLTAETGYTPFLSYWGDWDGSTRPSGQGHLLVASVLLENVRQTAALLRSLVKTSPGTSIDRKLLEEIEHLDRNMHRFKRLLDEITFLTHQLERRYRGVLPLRLTSGLIRRAGIKIRLARDPLTTLWQHNDRLERRMVTLRQKRKEGLQYYFSLNKSLRKALHGAIPSIVKSARGPGLALQAALYRNLLKRVVITPRIHQKLITTLDQFAIDTTVHNITEINDIAGASGNPGMILALQVSMSTSPDALVALDRKLRARREATLRVSQASDLPPVWLVPLFEDMKAVDAATEYLNKIWEYSLQSRRLRQETRERFTEIIPEVFIAGSDLSQQIGQTAGAAMFRNAKQQIVSWLAERGLVGEVRIKLGSGEPMQRQGGYFAAHSGLPAFLTTQENLRRLSRSLPASVKKSVEYATTPLMGVFAARDLRTVQSNLAEQVRSLPVLEYARLLLHVYESQRFYERELARAAEPLIETRLRFASRGLQELERLTVGKKDAVFDEFVRLATENFRHIVYGKPEDVVGIHIVSYFIARTTPPLRDRPTFRTGRRPAEGGQILERIAETIPLSTYGSLLRAIAHNQAQTAVLGINQLTTGLFRALDLFAAKQFREGAGVSLLADRIMPNLPVYEILQSLRLYHDVELIHLRSLENAFPAGNSALAALREDIDAMGHYLGPLRKELVRRHGLSVPDFFDGDLFLPGLLPAVRPDLAVLLQPDLFNTGPEEFFDHLEGTLDTGWKNEVSRLLNIPRMIGSWRARAWTLLREPVLGRVSSFVELALALSTLSGTDTPHPPPLPAALRRKVHLSPPLAGEMTEDSMRQFLGAALEYLTELSQQQLEVPTTVVKALQEVERIMKIEEQALPPPRQEELRFYLLQIARLAGENG